MLRLSFAPVSADWNSSLLGQPTPWGCSAALQPGLEVLLAPEQQLVQEDLPGRAQVLEGQGNIQ